jgi:hypothetical protein
VTHVEPNRRESWVSLILSAVIGPPVLALGCSGLAVLAAGVLEMNVVVSLLLPLLAGILIAFLVAGFRRARNIAVEVIFLLVAGIMSILTFACVLLLAGAALGGGLY